MLYKYINMNVHTHIYYLGIMMRQSLLVLVKTRTFTLGKFAKSKSQQ